MSVMVPLFGILLARDLTRAPRALVARAPLAAALLAAVVGAFGVLVCGRWMAWSGQEGEAVSGLAVSRNSPVAAKFTWPIVYLGFRSERRAS